jgi:anti-sigma factor RsiW
MECCRYTTEFLSAHVDGHLSGQELLTADDHLQSCERCRATFAEEHRVKALIRTSSPFTKVPADVRMRIRAALGEVTDPDMNARRTDPRRESGFPARRAVRVARWMKARPLRIAIPSAAVASLVLLVALGVGPFATRATSPSVPPTPVFDLAAASFDGLARGFEPNVATEPPHDGDGAYYAWVVDRTSDGRRPDELADLARAYREAGIPEDIYDFTSAGYALYGGRIDQSVDGWPMSYTVYRGDKGEILSICMHAPGFAAPLGARYWSGSHSFFQYQDHSLCLTFGPAGHFVSILVSREPVADLLRDVTLADAAAMAS